MLRVLLLTYVDVTEFAALTKEGAAVEGHSKDPFISPSVCPSLPACSVRFAWCSVGQPKAALSKSWANASPGQPPAPDGTECHHYMQSTQ